MSLDEELRTTLGIEAGMRTVPPPDVVGLIHGGRARRRRRTLVRAAVAVAASVAVGAATLGYVSLDPRAEGEVVSPPSPSPRPLLETYSDDGRAPLEPGTYRVLAGRHGLDGAAVEVDVTVDGPGWKHGDFPLLSDRSGAVHAGVGAYQAFSLASGDGCEAGPTVAAARTPAALATQLAGLPRSTVLRAPAPARILGRHAVHLRLRVEVGCRSYYRVAHTASGSRGISYTPSGLPSSDVVIDFWVLRAGGVVLVVDEWHDVDAPADLLARARAARQSIRFVGGG